MTIQLDAVFRGISISGRFVAAALQLFFELLVRALSMTVIAERLEAFRQEHNGVVDSSCAKEVASASSQTLKLAKESLEPFAVAREYLRSELDIDDTLIDHDQQLVRYVFRLSYKKLYAPLAALCVRVVPASMPARRW